MARIDLLFCLAALALLSLFQGALASPAVDKARNCPGKPVCKRTAQQVVSKLGLIANPEKGYFKETFRDSLLIETANGNRSASTAIYYLLEGAVGESLWHRVDAAEVWHYYAGAPLTLSLSNNDGTGVRKVVLGPDIFKGHQPQVIIASWEWQSAKSHGDWTLVGTTGELPLSKSPSCE